MAATPTAEPARHVAGDTLKFIRTLPDYLASAGWLLSYALVSASARYTFTGAAQGADHLINVPSSTTSEWLAGDYALRGQVTRAGEVYTVVDRRMVIVSSLAAALETRSLARQQLDNVEALLLDRSNSAVADYEIAGRKLAYIPVTELLVLRDRLRQDVKREDNAARAAAGLPSSGRVMVRFG